MKNEHANMAGKHNMGIVLLCVNSVHEIVQLQLHERDVCKREWIYVSETMIKASGILSTLTIHGPEQMTSAQMNHIRSQPYIR